MNKEEYLKYHGDMCDRMKETCRKKNADYCGASADPFHNFTRVEAIGIASTEQGFLTRMFDKFARITTFVQKGVLLVDDESVEDTLLDLANYSILMAGYIRHKKQAATVSGPHIKPTDLDVETSDNYQRAWGDQRLPPPMPHVREEHYK